jgi:predicted secreted protein
MEATKGKEVLLHLYNLRTNTYSRLMANYREKRLKKQKKKFQIQMAVLSGSIRRIK